jgi:hypothetical protein
VLNRFNDAPTIQLQLVVLKQAIRVSAVTNYSKTFKINGIDTEHGKEMGDLAIPFLSICRMLLITLLHLIYINHGT